MTRVGAALLGVFAVACWGLGAAWGEAGAGPASLDLGVAVEPNARVVGLDLDGDGRDEIAVASARGLLVLRREGEAFRTVWRAPARGGATAVASGDLDGDGAADLIVGWGTHREHRDAPAVLSVYRSRGAAPDARIEDLASRPETSRAQFTSLRVAPLEAGGPPGLLYAHFVSKYDTRAAWLRWEAGSWTERELGRIRMATYWALAEPPLAGKRIFVGRPYGDAVKSDGDVFALGADGTRAALPSVRGVRSLAVIEVGSAASPRRRVCYGDGWHWRYREQAEALLTCARSVAGGGLVAERVDDTEGYEINHLMTGDMDGDGVTELIALGSDAAFAYTPVGDSQEGGWRSRRVGPGGRSLAVVDTDGDGRDEIVIGGEQPALWFLRP